MTVTGASIGLNAHEFLEPSIQGHTSPLGMHEGDASLFEQIGKKAKKIIQALDLNNGNVFGTKTALKGATDDVLLQTYNKYQNPTTKQGEAILNYIKEEMTKRGINQPKPINPGWLSDKPFTDYGFKFGETPTPKPPVPVPPHNLPVPTPKPPVPVPTPPHNVPVIIDPPKPPVPTPTPGPGILDKIKDTLGKVNWKKVGKYALIAAAIGAGIWALSKCTGNKDKDVKPVTPTPIKPDPKPQPQPKPCDDKDLGNTFIEYHKKGGDSWKGIVEAYYPDLVEQCGGKMYGPDGAIRTLQKAMCTDIATGELDEEKLRQTYTSKDLPKTMFLPKEIGDIKIKDDAEIQKAKFKPAGEEAKVDSIGSYTRAVKRCGEDEISYVRAS